MLFALAIPFFFFLQAKTLVRYSYPPRLRFDIQPRPSRLHTRKAELHEISCHLVLSFGIVGKSWSYELIDRSCFFSFPFSFLSTYILQTAEVEQTSIPLQLDSYTTSSFYFCTPLSFYLQSERPLALFADASAHWFFLLLSSLYETSLAIDEIKSHAWALFSYFSIRYAHFFAFRKRIVFLGINGLLHQ